ncbi:30S ribosomal protein S20 [bacterium]|jgi:small subunit ribosomal protein S20|nr:30S ribosomal protein S20 [bacterium]
MANIKSAKKRALQNEKRHLINLARKTAVKTAVKKVLNSLAKSDPIEETRAFFLDAQKKIASAKGKGVLHANTASRKISRLAKKCNEAELQVDGESKPKTVTKKAAATKSKSVAKKKTAATKKKTVPAKKKA